MPVIMRAYSLGNATSEEKQGVIMRNAESFDSALHM